jgi:O-antigen ligase
MSVATAWPRSSKLDRASLRPGVRTVVGSTAQMTLGVILALLYLLAIGAQQDQLAVGMIALSALIAVIWPATGLAMFALVMPLREAEILVPVRFNAIMAGAIALGCLLRLPIDRLPLRVHPGIVLLLGYLLISALSIVPLLSGHPLNWTPSALNILLRLGTGVALFLSASYLFRLMSSRTVIALAISGATIAALLALADTLNVLPFESVTRGLVDNTGRLRASGAFADPNFFGLYMATAAVFVSGVIAVARWRVKLLLLPVVVLLFACVALSYSRSAYIGAIAVMVVLIGLRSRIAGLVLLVVIAILAVTLYPAFLEARQGALLSQADRYAMLLSQETRAKVAVAALAMFAAYPLFGVGFGVFQYMSLPYIEGGTADSTYSHDQYLNVLAEQGIVGVVMVAAMLVLLTIAVVRSSSPLRQAALAMGATYLAASLFLHSATVFQSASLIWLVMAAVLATGPTRTTQVSEA